VQLLEILYFAVLVYHLCYTACMETFETINAVIANVALFACVAWVVWMVLQ
jgi:hypothetical protein